MLVYDAGVGAEAQRSRPSRLVVCNHFCVVVHGAAKMRKRRCCNSRLHMCVCVFVLMSGTLGFLSRKKIDIERFGSRSKI